MTEFLESPDRIVALQRYVGDQIRWSQANFARNMVRMVVTLQYRYDHAYPAGKIYPVSGQMTVWLRKVSYIHLLEYRTRSTSRRN